MKKKINLSSLSDITSLEEVSVPEGLLPSQEYPHLVTLRAGALSLVEGRTLEDINNLLARIDFILFRTRSIFEADLYEKWKDKKEVRHVPVWDADRLLYVMASNEWQKHLKLTDINWPECLGALALRWFQAGVRAAQNPIRFTEDPTLELSPPTATERLAECSYAFQQADKLVSAAELLIQKRIDSKQQRKAAEARHAPAREIKQRFIDFYQSNAYATKASAARAFFKSLTEEERKILTPTRNPDNAQRTLINALNEYLKGKSNFRLKKQGS